MRSGFIFATDRLRFGSILGSDHYQPLNLPQNASTSCLPSTTL